MSLEKLIDASMRGKKVSSLKVVKILKIEATKHDINGNRKYNLYCQDMNSFNKVDYRSVNKYGRNFYEGDILLIEAYETPTGKHKIKDYQLLKVDMFTINSTTWINSYHNSLTTTRINSIRFDMGIFIKLKAISLAIKFYFDQKGDERLLIHLNKDNLNHLCLNDYIITNKTLYKVSELRDTWVDRKKDMV